MITFRIPAKEPTREFTMIFRFLLWEIKRKGLRILRILVASCYSKAGVAAKAKAKAKAQAAFLMCMSDELSLREERRVQAPRVRGA